MAVDDVNDTPPRFSDALYTYTVSEDAQPGDVITTMEAEDADEVGDVSYQLQNGGTSKFTVDPVSGKKRVCSHCFVDSTRS